MLYQPTEPSIYIYMETQSGAANPKGEVLGYILLKAGALREGGIARELVHSSNT